MKKTEGFCHKQIQKSIMTIDSIADTLDVLAHVYRLVDFQTIEYIVNKEKEKVQRYNDILTDIYDDYSYLDRTDFENAYNKYVILSSAAKTHAEKIREKSSTGP